MLARQPKEIRPFWGAASGSGSQTLCGGDLFVFGAPAVAAVDVDWTRWAGTWYEIARLPVPYEADCVGVPSATYRVSAQPAQLTVVNECARRCPSDRYCIASIDRVDGTARIVGAGRLWVTLGPTIREPTNRESILGNYVIAHVDGAYTEAVVVTPDLASAWILSRWPSIDDRALHTLVERARSLGIDTTRLIFNQS
jgi:apolipoprotein D and lipocalin family protein